jgi:hypothetical protein
MSLKSQRVVNLAIGIALIAIATTSVAVRRHWVNGLKLHPVDTPISTVAGQTTKKEFTVDVDYQYMVILQFDKHADSEDTFECLAGIATPFNSCREITPVAQVKWALSSDGKLAARGTAKEGNNLNFFEGKVGRRYEISITIAGDANRLAPGHPQLVIRPAPEFHESWSATYFFVEPLAGLCAAVGLILIGLSVHDRRRQGANSSTYGQ